MVTIHFDDLRARLTGDLPERVMEPLRRATSYFRTGFQFTTAYRNRRKGRGGWDGRTSLLVRPTNTFPAGLVPAVVTALESAKVDFRLVNQRGVPGAPPEPAKDLLVGITLRDYQMRLLRAAVRGGSKPLYRILGENAKRLDARLKLPDRKQAVVDQRLPGRGIWWAATGSGKTEAAIALTKMLGCRTLFVVRGNTLVDQTRRRFADRLGVDIDQIGRVAEGQWAIRSVTIGGIDSLTVALKTKAARAVLVQYLSTIRLLFADECHTAGSDGFNTMVSLCPAYYRIAMSGTPLDRTDGANLRLIASFGEVLERVPLKEMIDKGISPRARIRFIEVAEPNLPDECSFQTAYKAAVTENTWLTNRICSEVSKAREKGLSVLILVDKLKQGKLISSRIWKGRVGGDFIVNEFIHGKHTLEERDEALDKFRAGELPVLIASGIFSTGIDVPNFDVIIAAAGGKSPINALQRIGRGMRGDRLEYIEFDFRKTHKHLAKHTRARIRVYKAERCFDLEMVK